MYESRAKVCVFFFFFLGFDPIDTHLEEVAFDVCTRHLDV